MKHYKIAVLTENPISTLGGVERFTQSLQYYFENEGHEVTIYDKTIIKKQIRPNLFNKYLSTIVTNKFFGNDAAKIINEKAFDIIIQNGLSAWSICKHTNIPRIVIHHGTWKEVSKHLAKKSKSIKKILANKILTYFLNGTYEWMTSRKAFNVGVSTSVKNELKKQYYGLDSVAIQNGIDTNLYKKLDQKECKRKYQLREDEFVISFTGRLEYRKGNDILKDLSHLAYEQEPSIKFLFAVDKKVDGFADNVIFLENVAYEEMPNVYSASDLFIMPTRYEGCSYSIIEAMSCQTPILISNVGHGIDISKYGELNQVVLDELDSDVYWKKLLELKKNKELLHTIGTSAKNYVKEYNTIEACGKAYVNLINEILSR